MTLWQITTLGKDSPHVQETSQAACSHNQLEGMEFLQGSLSMALLGMKRAAEDCGEKNTGRGRYSKGRSAIGQVRAKRSVF